MTNCTSIQVSMFETVDLTAVRLVFGMLYSLVWIAAIVGNTLVLYVVSFNQVSEFSHGICSVDYPSA